MFTYTSRNPGAAAGFNGGVSTAPSMLFMVLILMLGVPLNSMLLAGADDEPRSCSDIAQGLATSCQEYMMGDNPSSPPQDSECCSFVNDPNVFCVCDLTIPPGVIDETALNNVIDACGLIVPPEHYDCAGFRIGHGE